MGVLRNISLSVGPNKDQRLLAEYLIRNKSEVEKLVIYYFSGIGSASTNNHSEFLHTKEQIKSLNGNFGPEEE